MFSLQARIHLFNVTNANDVTEKGHLPKVRFILDVITDCSALLGV